MESYEKAIIIFSGCESKAMTESSSPAIAKLLRKGTLLKNVSREGDIKTQAAAGAGTGETIWEAAATHGFVVGGLDEQFDMAVLDAGASVGELEDAVIKTMEAASRTTVIAVVLAGGIVFYGLGFAKGKTVEDEYTPCCVAPTVAYVANFPVPAQCRGAVAYAALNNINLKLKEITKLKGAIKNMEVAMERKARQPWDKHDCA